MSSNRNKLDLIGLKLSLKNRHNSKLKMAAVLALIVSTVTFNLGFANEADKEEFEKIFHVYVADAYIGAVANEASIQQLVEQKEQDASMQYKDYTIDAGSDITIVPEQVFTVDTEEQETLTKLEEVITVQAQAYSLQVGGTVVASLKDQDDFKAVIDGIKLQYISQQQLNELEARASSNSLPELQVGQTRLVDVTLSTDVTGQERSVDPSEIVTVQEAIQLLQTGTLETESYEVQAGDVLGLIAQKHGLKIAQLLQLNPFLTEDSILRIGDQLNVTVEKPYVSVKAIYEKKAAQEIEFAKIVEEDDTMLKGERIVKQEGTNGKKEVSYLITEENGVRTERIPTAENILVEPQDYVVVIGTKVIPSVGTGTFAWPANGGYISSQMGHRWGRYHYGIDIARPSNYTIKASDNGVVKTAGRHSTYGNYVVIDHNNGYESLYAHLSKIDVEVGQVVGQGVAIGVMGSTGRSTGTHLHFEIHKNGAEVNPLAYLE
jgi:murein DD-endopeptidase MepM/ murein hydrolase activator NlpD